jgi:hypothetical protein
MEENTVSTRFSGSMEIATPLNSTRDKAEEGKKVAERLRGIQEILGSKK